MSDVITVTEESFEREVLESDLPVLVDYWAVWCGPCRAVQPVLEAIAKERTGSLKVAKVNVDEQPALAARAGVQSIPYLVLYRGGEPAAHAIGAQGKAGLERTLGLEPVAPAVS